MRRLTLSIALVVLVAACGDDTATTAAARPTSSTAPAATTIEPSNTTTTTEPPATTTTQQPTTTTTTQPQFEPQNPSEDDRASYLLLAALTLSDSEKFGLDAMGIDAWGDMLRDGPLSACATLFYGGSLAEAAYAAMQETPLAGQDPKEYDSIASSVWTTFAISGMPLYCPSLTSSFQTDAVTIVNAWGELTGGEIIDPDEIIEDGTWIVGTEVQPGTYRNSGIGSGCYWERLSGFSGTSEDRIANGFSDDQQIVTIDPSDAGFLSDGCGTWFLVE